jgi:hypothetical protein
MTLKFTLVCIVLLAFSGSLFAQEETVSFKNFGYKWPGAGKVYVTGGGDGSILSFANVSDNGKKVTSIPRFTTFFNVGTNYNYDITPHFGVFSGTSIRNIGLITKTDSLKLKRRVFAFNIPVGFKIGDLKKGTFLFAGGEISIPYRYKEKRFINGDKKSKSLEWFSDRTPRLMPSVFAGFNIGSFGVKGQYFLNDFFNKDFTENNSSVKPYQNLTSKIFFLTLSYNFSVKAMKNGKTR